MIDCDVHNEIPSWEVLLDYLDDYWKESMTQGGFQGPTASPYLPSGPHPTTLQDVREWVLGADGIDGGILTCTYAVESLHNPHAAAALAAAVNDWQISTWLDPEPRLRGSIVVPSAVPADAAREIDRVGGHPRLVQVILPARSLMPYGNPNYLPVFGAAERHGLNICIHAGGMTGLAPTSHGWPSYHAEQIANMSCSFQAQLMSLVLEGTLDRFPSVSVILAESGFAWLPSFSWRFDKEWKGLRRETPWVSRPPSEIIGERVSVTLHPFDCPADRVESVLERLPGDMLLYATDYPHLHRELPPTLQLARLIGRSKEVYSWS